MTLGRKISDVVELPSMGRVITLEQVRRKELRVEARDSGYFNDESLVEEGGKGDQK